MLDGTQPRSLRASSGDILEGGARLRHERWLKPLAPLPKCLTKSNWPPLVAFLDISDLFRLFRRGCGRKCGCKAHGAPDGKVDRATGPTARTRLAQRRRWAVSTYRGQAPPLVGVPLQRRRQTLSRPGTGAYDRAR